jgi:hypothetical protein
LTVNVNITNNTTIILIKNLPFNTSDYNDALIVLEENFRSNLLLSKADMLNYITITYHIVNKEKYFISSMKNTYTFLILASLLLIIYTGIYYYIIFTNQPLYIVEIPVETFDEKPNRCALGLFSEFFKINNPSYAYYPSQFLPSNMRYNINFEELSILDRVMHVQYEKLYDLTQITNKYIETLRDIIKETSNSITSV